MPHPEVLASDIAQVNGVADTMVQDDRIVVDIDSPTPDTDTEIRRLASQDNASISGEPGSGQLIVEY